MAEDLVKRGRCPPVGPGISGAIGIDEQTLVVKYQPLYARVTDVSGGVALQFAQLVITARSDHKEALQFLSKSTEPFRVCDLPGLSAAQQTELARTLIVSGFLVRLPDDLMELTDLVHWTPIRFDFSGPAPTVDWADLSAERFVEPFFDQTVARWASGPHARPLVRTGLEALVALDDEPSLEPAGMIFHLSRCGSTLVSRLLGTLPGVVVPPNRRRSTRSSASSPIGSTRPRWSGSCGFWCGRSADAGTATNGTWCSSARAGTSAAARSWPPPFPTRRGSGSSATRRTS